MYLEDFKVKPFMEIFLYFLPFLLFSTLPSTLTHTFFNFFYPFYIPILSYFCIIFVTEKVAPLSYSLF